MLTDTKRETKTTDPEEKNRGEAETKPYAWPRYVFKKGSARLVDEENGKYECETRLVHDEDELSRLGTGWMNTPKEAVGAPVSNANATVTYNEDGTVEVVPKGGPNAAVDTNGDMMRRTFIDNDGPKPRLDNNGKK